MNHTSRILRSLLLFVLLLSFGGQPALASSLPAAPAPQVAPPPDDAQSTTGPTPPMGLSLAVSETPTLTLASNTVNVPAYLWTHGCGPTAAGMVIGYWDAHGFSKLYPGTSNSSTQDSNVDEMIASSLQTYSHVNDYAYPIETDTSGMLTDNYLQLGYTPHTDNSLADFMLTSRSTRGNQYGWSYFSDVRPTFLNYVQYINSHYDRAYHASSTNYYYSSSLWSQYVAEIEAGRPVVFLVDSSGDGWTDHFVTGTGYGYSQGQPVYRLNHTWDRDTEYWAYFRPMQSGQYWGIYGMTTFRISGLDIPTAQIKHSFLPAVRR